MLRSRTGSRARGESEASTASSRKPSFSLFRRGSHRSRSGTQSTTTSETGEGHGFRDEVRAMNHGRSRLSTEEFIDESEGCEVGSFGAGNDHDEDYGEGVSRNSGSRNYATSQNSASAVHLANQENRISRRSILGGAQLANPQAKLSLRKSSKRALSVVARISRRMRDSAAQKFDTRRSKARDSTQNPADGRLIKNADAAESVYTVPGGPAPTHLLAWGDNSAGQLLREGGRCAETSSRDVSSCSGILDSLCIVQVGASGSHSIAVTADGKLIGAGDNSEGQLHVDKQAEDFMHNPMPIADSFLSKQHIVQASCGDAHTAVLTSAGRVITWGNNEAGQLGHSRDRDIYNVGPRLVEKLHEIIIQVACTGSSTLLLSQRGRVFSFGGNLDGVLGLGDGENRASPKMVRGALDGNPIVQIAAGGNHVCAVSSTGRVYAWGSNSHGQLGFARKGAPSFCTSPDRVVLSRAVAKVACGAEHTVFLTVAGGVYVCGRPDQGQLGMSPKKSHRNVTPPRRLEALSSFPHIPVQVAAAQHSTVLLFENGAVYVAGNSAPEKKMYDFGTFKSAIRGPRLSSGGISDLKLPRFSAHGNDTIDEESSFDLSRHNSSDESSSGSRTDERVSSSGGEEESEIDSFPTDDGQTEILPGFVRALDETANVVSISAGGESIFALSSDDDTLDRREVMSRGWPKQVILDFTGSDLSALAEDILIKFGKQGRKSVRTFRRSVNLELFDFCTLNSSFLTGTYSSTHRSSPDKFDEKRNSCIEFESMLSGMEALLESFQTTMGPETASMYLRERLAPIIGQLDEAASHLTEPDQLRVFLVLFMSPFMRATPKEYDLLVATFRKLPSRSRDVLLSWIKYDINSNLIAAYLVDPLLGLLDKSVMFTRFDDTCKEVCTLLRYLYRINQSRPRDNSSMSRIDHTRFYSKHMQELGKTLERWRKILATRQQLRHQEAYLGRNAATHALVHEFNLFDYPFLLSAGVKRRILQVEDQTTQLRNILVSRLFSSEPFYTLNVRRTHLLEDTMSQIENTRGQSTELRKPLRVKFVGEQGLDAGGVRKEFFQLLSAQLFQPDCGLFRRNGDTNTLWFNAFDEDLADASRPYLLVGTLIGLAIYNSTLLDVQFPLLFWRILLNKVPRKPTLDNLEELDASLAKNVKSLLEYDEPDFEDVFMQNFEVSVDIFGVRRDVELVRGGADIAVTLDNRNEYVDALVKYLVVDSIGANAKDLVEGFNRVIPNDIPSLNLFEPDELELAVCGTPELDFDELHRIASYEGGYDEDHETVKRFWHIVNSFSYDQKQQFLRFTTGSPKSPVGGLAALMSFKVQRAGPDTDQLPTSHTCFNTIMLPDYSSEEKMRDRLCLALEHSIGFGLE